MTMNVTLKSQLQARISAVNAATPIEDLLRLAAIARTEPFNTVALDDQIAERSASVTAGSSLATLFALAAAAGEPRDVPVGGIIRASLSLPPVYDDRYIAAGNFVTAGFSPKLQDMFDNFFGYKASEGTFAGGGSDYTRGFDIDGVGTIILPSGGGELFRSTDNGATWTDIKALVNWNASAKGAVKHLSGTGNLGKWLVQHSNGGGFISTDGGATWSSVATLTLASSGNAFLTASTSGQYVIAKGSNNSAILRSTNSGAAFTQITLSGASALVTCAVHVTGGIFIAAGCFGSSSYPCYWISTDNGATWSNPVALDNTGTGCVYSICYAPKYDRVYFAGFAGTKLAAIKAVSTGVPVAIPPVINGLVFVTAPENYLGLAATSDGFLFAKSGQNNGYIFKETADESTLIGKAPIMPNQLGASGGVISDGSKFYARSSAANRFDVIQHAVGLHPNTQASALASNEIQYMRYR